MNLLVSAAEYGHMNQENAIRRIFIRSLKNHKEKVQESINHKRNMNKEGGNPIEKSTIEESNIPQYQNNYSQISPFLYQRNVSNPNNFIPNNNFQRNGTTSSLYSPNIHNLNPMMEQQAFFSQNAQSQDLHIPFTASNQNLPTNPNNFSNELKNDLTKQIFTFFEDFKTSISSQILNIQQTQAQNSNIINQICTEIQQIKSTKNPSSSKNNGLKNSEGQEIEEENKEADTRNKEQNKRGGKTGRGRGRGKK